MLSVRFSCLLLLSVLNARAQPLSIVLKNKSAVIDRFWQGSVMAFQLDNLQWEKGELMQIRPDSFYIRPFTIKYTMTGPDTTFYGIDGYALSDIYSLPKKGYQVEYFNGGWNIAMSAGHVHWYWVKSGWIFRILGLGYIALQSLNGIIRQNFSLSSNAAGFGVAGAVALGGFVLKKTYHKTLKVGKKYRLSIY